MQCALELSLQLHPLLFILLNITIDYNYFTVKMLCFFQNSIIFLFSITQTCLFGSGLI